MENEIEIKKVIKKKKKYLVITEEEDYEFDEDTIVKWEVLPGRRFSKNDFKKVLSDLNTNKAFQKALNYLRYGPRTVKEMENYLDDYANSNVVIKKLKDFHYLDDNRYVNTFLDSVKRNKKGPEYLKNSLKLKGINANLIVDCLKNYSKSEEEEIISFVIEKFISKNVGFPVNRIKRSLMEKLIRDGFTQELINHKISTLELVDNSYDNLQKDFAKLQKKFASAKEEERKQKIVNALLRRGYEYANIQKLFE